jgi:hypothetical protein
VAESVVACLEARGARGWVDVLDGEEKALSEVERVVREGVDAVEGEDLAAFAERIKGL